MGSLGPAGVGDQRISLGSLLRLPTFLLICSLRRKNEYSSCPSVSRIDTRMCAYCIVGDDRCQPERGNGAGGDQRVELRPDQLCPPDLRNRGNWFCALLGPRHQRAIGRRVSTCQRRPWRSVGRRSHRSRHHVRASDRRKHPVLGKQRGRTARRIIENNQPRLGWNDSRSDRRDVNTYLCCPFEQFSPLLG